MHFLQAINSDISVLIVCNKTGGTIKGDIKKNMLIGCDVQMLILQKPPPLRTHLVIKMYNSSYFLYNLYRLYLCKR